MKKNLSALKRIRQSEKRRVRNKSAKSKVATYFKKLTSVMAENKSKDEVINAYKEWQSVIDKIAGKGVIHKNTAARKKTRVMAKINSMFPVK